LEPIQYLRGLRRRWFVIVAAIGLGVAAAWLTTSVTAVATSSAGGYDATTTLITLGGNNQSSLPQVSITTAANLVTIPDISNAVAKEIHFPRSATELATRVTGTADEKTGLLKITATGDSPNQAQVVADAFAGQLVIFLNQQQKQIADAELKPITAQLKSLKKEITDLENKIAGLSRTQGQLLQTELNSKLSTYSSLSSQSEQINTSASSGSGLLIVQKAIAQKAQQTGFQAPRSRASRMILGGIVGLLIGVALALVLDRLDNRIRTKQDAEGHFSLPVLAEIPLFPRRRRKELDVSSSRRSRSKNAFRLLGAGLVVPGARGETPNGDGQKRPQTILVTSAGPGEGASTVVANLASTYAEQGQEVLVLSCDFRHPRIHRLLGIPGERGLSEALELANHGPVLTNHVRGSKFVRRVRVVPSRSEAERSAELLSSDAMKRAITEARGDADVVLLDTAPLLSASEATSLLSEVDAVLVVARAGKTTTEVADHLGEFLKRLGAPAAGVALNGSTDDGVPHQRWYRRVFARWEGRSERDKGEIGSATGPAIPATAMHSTPATRSIAIPVKATRATAEPTPDTTVPEPTPQEPTPNEPSAAALRTMAEARARAEAALLAADRPVPAEPTSSEAAPPVTEPIAPDSIVDEPARASGANPGSSVDDATSAPRQNFPTSWRALSPEPDPPMPDPGTERRAADATLVVPEPAPATPGATTSDRTLPDDAAVLSAGPISPEVHAFRAAPPPTERPYIRPSEAPDPAHTEPRATPEPARPAQPLVLRAGPVSVAPEAGAEDQQTSDAPLNSAQASQPEPKAVADAAATWAPPSVTKPVPARPDTDARTASLSEEPAAGGSLPVPGALSSPATWASLAEMVWGSEDRDYE